MGRQAFMAEDVKQYLREKQDLINRRLRAVLRSDDGTPAALCEAMRYSVLAPGKRLRPLLVVLAAEACGGRDMDALAAAAAVEMVHTYSLIHDDLPAMDDDDLRRGQPACHKQYGEALAILAGDALLTLAFQTLTESYQPATAAACCLELARAAGAAGMVGGQVEDLAWERGELDNSAREAPTIGASAETRSVAVCSTAALPRTHSLEALENIHSRKTGALIRACLRIGLFVAQGERPGGPDPSAMKCLDAYGRCFGLAFQITDDLLDAEGSADETGKRVQKDAVRGKLTYPSFLGTDESRCRAQELCQEARARLEPLGRAGEHLAALVSSIGERRC